MEIEQLRWGIGRVGHLGIRLAKISRLKNWAPQKWKIWKFGLPELDNLETPRQFNH